MDYEYDVFLSYRRWREWPRWVKNNFFDIFEHWLGEELDWEPRIFFDECEVEQGSWWDMDLAIKLSQSRVLVPLFSRKYFQSDWCVTELSLMRKRENDLGLRTENDRRVLIKPAIIHDGNKFPAEAKRLQGKRLTCCTSVRMAPNSPKQEELDLLIQNWVPTIAKAIENVPAYNKDWESYNIQAFHETYRSNIGSTKNPSIG